MTNHQSKIEKLISELCPNGVEFKELGKLTAWDKRFNGIAREKQKKIVIYPYVLANRFKEIAQVSGNVRLLSTGNYIGWTTEKLAGKNLCEGEIVAIPWGGRANVKYYKGKFVTADNRIATSLDIKVLSNKYLYYWMLANNQLIESFYRGSGIKHPSMRKVLEFKIPLPPLAIQEEIVKILNSFTELEARKKQYEYYRLELLSVDEGVEKLPLEKVFNFKNGYTPSKAKSEYWENGEIPWFRMEDIRENGKILDKSIQLVNKSGVKGRGIFPENSIIVATSATIGEHALITIPHLTNQRFVSLSIKDELKQKLNIKFLFYYFYLLDEWCLKNTTKSSFASVDMVGFRKFQIPVPPIAEQERIVSILDKFDALVNDISIGLPAELKARRQQYEYYRGKLLTFNEYAKQ